MQGHPDATPAPPPRPARGRLRLIALKLAPATLLCSHLAGCAVVDHEQRRWIFMPRASAWPPALAAAVGMQDVWIIATEAIRAGGRCRA